MENIYLIIKLLKKSKKKIYKNKNVSKIKKKNIINSKKKKFLNLLSKYFVNIQFKNRKQTNIIFIKIFLNTNLEISHFFFNFQM